MVFPSSDALVSRLDGVPASTPTDSVIPTGFARLDELLHGGLRGGQLTMLAGVTGAGSSLLALGIARRAALVDGLPVFLLAPDSSTHEIHARVLAAESTVVLGRIRSGSLGPDERRRLAEQRHRLEVADLLVSADQTEVTARTLAGSVETLAAEGCGLAVVDGTSAAEPDVRDLVRSLRRTAHRYRTAVVVTTRAVLPPSRPAGPPWLEDLPEHESCADLVDLVLSVHRPDLHDHECPRPGEADLEILKHRHGPIGPVVTVAFQGHYARFVDVAPARVV